MKTEQAFPCFRDLFVGIYDPTHCWGGGNNKLGLATYLWLLWSLRVELC